MSGRAKTVFPSGFESGWLERTGTAAGGKLNIDRYFWFWLLSYDRVVKQINP